jgi:hypothetical protein
MLVIVLSTFSFSFCSKPLFLFNNLYIVNTFTINETPKREAKTITSALR